MPGHGTWDVKDYNAVSEERANGVDSSDWIYPSLRPMPWISPIVLMHIFKFSLVDSRWLESGFHQYPFSTEASRAGDRLFSLMTAYY